MCNQNYCYSYDGENFIDFDEEVKSETKAIELAQKILQGGKRTNLWIGVAHPITANEIIPYLGDEIIDLISENAYDEHGECAEYYLNDVSKTEEVELHNALKEVVEKWLIKYHHEPPFFAVDIKQRIYR